MSSIRLMDDPTDKCLTIMLAADGDASTSVIELSQMKQQMEMRRPEDDWTGLTDAAARRKLQNRLNQRIYRKRRGTKPNSPKPKPNSPNVVVPPLEPGLSGKFKGLATVDSVNKTQDDNESDSPRAVPTKKNLTASGSRYIKRAQLEEMLFKFEQMARRDYMLGSPRVDQLLTLIQFNVFRALLSNTRTMGWSLEWLECTDPISPWNTIPPNSEALCPQALRPTRVQRNIEHHPWIDLWPIPKMRDNLLLAGTSYDEDQLCNDLIEFCDIPNEQTGLIVWCEPWDPASWEASETFLRKWGWIVKGCVELLQSTNYWRTRRGEKPLIFEV